VIDAKFQRLYLGLRGLQTRRTLHRLLQLVLNFAARAVAVTPKYNHITPVLKSLHWLKINQRIEYKILSLVYKILQSHQPTYLSSLVTIQPMKHTRSASVITLKRPSVSSRLQITNRSFYFTAPALWNSLPLDLRQPSSSISSDFSPFLLSPSQFRKRLKTHLFCHSYPP
jgi:hypothetical protein